MKEHKYDFKTCNMNNAIFYHATEKDHEILWEESKLLFKCSNCQKRHMVESVLIDNIDNFHLFPALILLLGSMHLFSLFLKRVTAPTPPTIALLLSLRLLLRFSKLCLTPTSSNILNLTIFFQITSMVSVRQDLQWIFFPILLMPGHPLLGTSENHSSSLLISRRHLTESGINLCYPNFLL